MDGRPGAGGSSVVEEEKDGWTREGLWGERAKIKGHYEGNLKESPNNGGKKPQLEASWPNGSYGNPHTMQGVANTLSCYLQTNGKALLLKTVPT